MRVHRHALWIVMVANTMMTSGQAFGEDDRVTWTSSLSEASSASRKLNRPILVYVESEHCGWCRKMDRTTWADPSVARLVNERFVTLKLNGDEDSPRLEKWKISGYPSIVVLSSSGEVVLRHDGYQSSRDLLRRLDRVAPSRPRSALNRSQVPPSGESARNR